MPTGFAVRADAIATWARYHRALRSFEGVAAALRALDVPLVPVKGIALARWLYDDVADRPFGDVDLLVPRGAWQTAWDALLRLGPVMYESRELGELSVSVQGTMIEIHAEVGRLEVTDFTVDEFVARSRVDVDTFGFPVRRIDEVDHLLLVAINAVKDGFVHNGPHIPVDLERLLHRVANRTDELVARAQGAYFATGLYCTAEWMVEEHASVVWRGVLAQLTPPVRLLHRTLVRLVRRSPYAPELVAIALGSCANDRVVRRASALARMLRRRSLKLMGRRVG